jgi:hypothetical protein
MTGARDHRLAQTRMNQAPSVSTERMRPIDSSEVVNHTKVHYHDARSCRTAINHGSRVTRERLGEASSNTKEDEDAKDESGRKHAHSHLEHSLH